LLQNHRKFGDQFRSPNDLNCSIKEISLQMIRLIEQNGTLIEEIAKNKVFFKELLSLIRCFQNSLCFKKRLRIDFRII